jgi:hypothetical protein
MYSLIFDADTVDKEQYVAFRVVDNEILTNSIELPSRRTLLHGVI